MGRRGNEDNNNNSKIASNNHNTECANATGSFGFVAVWVTAALLHTGAGYIYDRLSSRGRLIFISSTLFVASLMPVVLWIMLPYQWEAGGALSLFLLTCPLHTPQPSNGNNSHDLLFMPGRCGASTGGAVHAGRVRQSRLLPPHEHL